jgi:hypothetical protein
MAVYRLDLEGTSRLLMEADTELIERRGRRGEYSDPEEWRSRVYWDDELGAVYFPSSWLRKAGQAAASKLARAGRDFLLGVAVNPDGALAIVTIPSGDGYVRITSLEDFAAGRHGCQVYVTHGRRPPRTGSRVPIYRPMIPKGWRCSYTVAPEDPFFTHERLRDIFERAGRINGFGGGRDLGFGRFRVLAFEPVP